VYLIYSPYPHLMTSSAPPASPTQVVAAADPHSYAALGTLRVRHLRLHLAVDFAQRTLAGMATWWLTCYPRTRHPRLAA
jgi:hypothetical protein